MMNLGDRILMLFSLRGHVIFVEDLCMSAIFTSDEVGA